MTLVLLHPVGLDAQCWQFMRLPDPVAVDLPGHGERSGEGVPGLAAMADDVAARVPGALDVVGLSMGGAVAQHLVLRHPQRVRSLVLACTSAATKPDVMAQRARAVRDGGMAAVTEPTLARWFTPAAMAGPPDHPGVAYARKRLLANSPEDFARGWEALGGHDVLADLPRISCPVTVVAGTVDQSSSLDGLRLIAGRIPGARLVELEGPHMLQLEQPETFSRAIHDHLEWASLPPYDKKDLT